MAMVHSPNGLAPLAYKGADNYLDWYATRHTTKSPNPDWPRAYTDQ